MLRKLTTVGVALALGGAAAVGAAACGEKRGSVQFEGDTGTATGKAGTSTSGGAETTSGGTSTMKTSKTTTSP